ncbi:MAG TPA: type II toxin-antitoxin system VapC family toxin [Candidatus Dormibacteraeota bacterium]
MALVVDASGLVHAVLGTSPEARGLRRRLGDEECHAPHLIDAEVGNVLRRRVVRGELPPHFGLALLRAGGALIDRLYEMSSSLAQAAWALRDRVSFYDALYVAVALALSCPLITADGRLARTPTLPCTVELIGP